MTEFSIPLVFWAGYVSPILVSSAHLREWTVVTSETPLIRTFPRRWVDILGSKMTDIWEAALRAVLGTILFRPGITQVSFRVYMTTIHYLIDNKAELMWRLRSIYDRQEVHDILCYLQEEGFVRSRLDPYSQATNEKRTDLTLFPDNMEEKSIFWFIGDTRRWYQL
jgi:hypothetical protein